jgi:exosortase A
MPEAVASPESNRAPLRQALWAAATYSVLLLLVFHQTSWSMVSIWLRSDTFAHGFLILPISLWLVWGKRQKLAGLCPRPVYAVTLLLMPLGFGWLVVWMVDVLVIQQLLLVAMLIVGVWAILGHDLTRALAFPLGFLFFAVPMGEALISPMMEFTATSTVWMIQQTGIPVFHEGLYFTLPSGSWSVVEACSGVRYLIASVTLGVLYAYLTYRSPWRRGVFVLASIIMPVFANTMRAYIIVMLGHMSDMKIATGADHLIYGWVFFGIVITLLFWVGSFFREEGGSASPGHIAVGTCTVEQPLVPRSLWPVSLVALLAAAVWPLLSVNMAADPVAFDDQQFAAIPLQDGWQPAQDARWGWLPGSSVKGQTSMHYHQDGRTVGAYIQYPSAVDKGGEVVGSIDAFVAHNSPWRVMAKNRGLVQLPQAQMATVEAIIDNGAGQRYIAWSWYRIGNRNIGNDYLAKGQEALSSLGLAPRGIFRLVLAVPVEPQDLEMGRQVLQRFLEDNLVHIERRIDQVGSGQ